MPNQQHEGGQLKGIILFFLLVFVLFPLIFIFPVGSYHVKEQAKSFENWNILSTKRNRLLRLYIQKKYVNRNVPAKTPSLPLTYTQFKTIFFSALFPKPKFPILIHVSTNQMNCLHKKQTRFVSYQLPRDMWFLSRALPVTLVKDPQIPFSKNEK